MTENNQANKEKYSHVIVRSKNESKKVKIGSSLKPEITSAVLKKWQSLLDTVARIVNVPSALIMRLNEDSIEVFLKSRTEGNPYEKGEEAKLIYGLYCETVIGTQKKLLVPNATQEEVWSTNNPDVDINMISYLGFPINWPDGEVLGTVCLLDSKENHYNENYAELLQQVKFLIETDLEQLITRQQLEENNQKLAQLNQNKSRLLSLISHDVRGGIGTINELLKIIIENLDHYSSEKLIIMFKTLSEKSGYSFQMLDNLLTWSKNDMVELKPVKKRYNIINQIENLLQYFHYSISMKEIHLVKNYSSEIVMVNADENMIKVSLRNILSNAVKYTQKGGQIILTVHQHKNRQIVEIEDNGIGMDKNLVEKLFTYNKEHSKTGTAGEDSAGIGLMLTKDFLDKNDARVEIESTPGKGTCFSIDFES